MNITLQPGTTKKETDWFQLVQGNPEHFVYRLLLLSSAELENILDQKDSNGFALIHRACIICNNLIVAALIEVGCSPDMLSDSGIAPIHLAAKGGQLLTIYLLQRMGANVCIKDNQGRVALHYAAESNEFCTLAWLLNNTRLFDLNVKDIHGVTPIHIICRFGNRFCLEYIFQYLNGRALKNHMYSDYAYLLESDHEGNTCLHMVLTEDNKKLSYYSRNIRVRVNELLWPLITSLPNAKADYSPLQMFKMRTLTTNQKPIDVAKRYPSISLPSDILLQLSDKLVTHCRSWISVRQILLGIYNIIWIFYFLLPTLCWIFIVNLFDTPVLMCLAVLTFVWLGRKQRYRLDDGTNRPNPFFSGLAVFVFVMTLYTFYTDLWDNVLLAQSQYPKYVVLVIVNSIIVFNIFVILIYRDPGRVNQEQKSFNLRRSNLNILSKWLDDEADKLFGWLNCVKAHQSHHGYKPPSIPSDIYCAHCNYATRDQSRRCCNRKNYVKHCKLCQTCISHFDHHCVYIMNCVGLNNQHIFILFLVLAASFNFQYLWQFAMLTWNNYHQSTTQSDRDMLEFPFDWIHFVVFVYSFKSAHSLLVLVVNAAVLMWLADFIFRECYKYKRYTMIFDHQLKSLIQQLTRCKTLLVSNILNKKGRRQTCDKDVGKIIDF